jgi:hypothetical protein
LAGAGGLVPRRIIDTAYLALLLQNIGPTPLLLCALHSEDEEATGRVRVRARVKSEGRKDDLLEQIVTRLSLEPSVTTIRWEIVSALDRGEEILGPVIVRNRRPNSTDRGGEM